MKNIIILVIILFYQSNIHCQNYTDEQIKIIENFYQEAKKKIKSNPESAVNDFNELIKVAPQVTIFYFHRAEINIGLNFSKNLPGNNEIINDLDVFLNNPQGFNDLIPYAQLYKGISLISINKTEEGCNLLNNYKSYFTDSDSKIFNKYCIKNNEAMDIVLNSASKELQKMQNGEYINNIRTCAWCGTKFKGDFYELDEYQLNHKNNCKIDFRTANYRGDKPFCTSKHANCYCLSKMGIPCSDK